MTAARRSPLRRALAMLIAAALIAVGASALIPSANAPQAAAAPINPGIGNCEFRSSSPSSTSYALSRQLCFLDLSGIDLSRLNVAQHQTKVIGQYTLSYDWTVTEGTSSVWAMDYATLESTNTYSAASAFGRSNSDGNMFTGGAGSSIIRHIGSWTTLPAYSFMRFSMTNISLVHTASGVPAGAYAFHIVDAEQTQRGEGLSIDDGNGSIVSPPRQRLTPPGRNAACSDRFGAANESQGYNNIDPSPALDRDLVCDALSGSQYANPGSFATTHAAPKSLTITSWTDDQQAFAIALNLGRVGGSVTADTTAFGASTAKAYELAATGGETGFDLAIWNDVSTAARPIVYVPAAGSGQAAIGPQDGSLTPYLRSTGSNADGSPRAGDALSFRSQGSHPPGGDPRSILQRYRPVWTCTQSAGLTEAQTFTLSETAGTITDQRTVGGSQVVYTTVNTPATGTSEVIVTNPDNVPVSCRVNWQSRYSASTLNLAKSVSGTAAGFPEVQNRSYTLSYQCTLAGFETAYPGVPLSGSVQVSGGQTRPVANLPQGAACSFSESFPPFPDPNNPGQTTTLPALPGKTLKLTWSSSPGVTGVYDSYDQSGLPLPTAQASLSASTTIGAANRYDYRGGIVDFSKTITGAPVRELANTTRTYSFEWGCAATDRGGQFQITVSYAADGTASGSGPQLSDVPVARDCWVRAVSNLTTAESAYITSLPRTVTATGDVLDASEAQAAERDPNTYHFRLADYQEPAGEPAATITSANASRALVTLTHPYEYRTTSLTILAQFSGTGADGARQEFGSAALFPVSYRCTFGNGGLLEGQVMLARNDSSPTTVPGIPIGAACAVWEDTANVPAGANVEFVERDADGVAQTTIRSADANDVMTTLTNDQAQTTPVRTMTASGANAVIVTNRYDQRLGTVSLEKIVDRGGVVGTLPDSFSFTFTCDARSIRNADGTVSAVPVSGTLTVAGGSSAPAVANAGDPASWPQLNDGPGGVLRVPYGTSCTFTEQAPTGLPPGVNVETESAQATIDGPENSASATNTFSAAGAGLTLRQSFGGAYPGLTPAGGSRYDVVCSNGYAGGFTLTPAAPTVTIPSGSAPAGTSCRVTESGESGTRTIDGVTFPIQRSSSATMAADGSSPAVDAAYPATSAGAPTPIDVEVTVGDSSVLALAHSYDYRYAPVTASKIVEFDAATEQWISDARKQVKRDRLFAVDLSCSLPTGGAPVVSRIEISASSTSLAGATAALGTLPQGARCTATEEESTTAAGVVLDRAASVNGAADADPATPAEAVAFVVGAVNDVTMTNSYRRELVDVELSKIAVLPEQVNASIRAALGDGFNAQLHAHDFTLDCRDPQAADAPLGVALTGSIQGEGQFLFQGVPAGTRCSITGTGFTQLDLVDSSGGTPLESHFRTSSVEWLIDADQASVIVDSDIPDSGVVQSPYVDVPADGTATHHVDLRNNYELLMTQVTGTKRIDATSAGFSLLEQSQPSYRFAFRCEGLGYAAWTIPESSGLPNPLQYGDFADAPASTGPTGPGQAERFQRSFTSEPISVPAGALCTAAELPPTGTPSELTHTTRHLDAQGQLVDGEQFTARTPGGSEAGTGDFSFVDVYDRRMVPVRLAMLQKGYLAGASEAGYSLQVVCSDPASTAAGISVPLADAGADESVSQGSAPSSGQIVMLPAGASCRLDLADSPALAARAELEVTRGERTPFVEYGVWDAAGVAAAPDPARAANPPVAAIDDPPYDDAAITEAMKSYQLTFDIPADAAPAEGQQQALTVAAEAMHARATVDLTVSKQTSGEVGADARYTFSSTCLADGTATISSGESFAMPNVAVGDECRISELDDGVDGAEARLSVSSAGEHIGFDPATGLVNQAGQPADGDQEAIPAVHAATVVAEPVDDPADLSRDGAGWSITLLNTFTALQLDKTIAGALVVSPADTAVLPHDARSFEVTYRISNTGGAPLGGFSLVDPSLAGRTLTRDGMPDLIVGADGAIDGTLLEACGLGPGAELAAGEHLDCTARVLLDEPVPSLVTVGAEAATVTASDDEGASVSGSDGHAALRPVTGLLPEAGMQTLVWILAIGLGILVYGLWRRRRRDDEDGDDLMPPAAIAEPADDGAER